jgi:hypothetical protein
MKDSMRQGVLKYFSHAKWFSFLLVAALLYFGVLPERELKSLHHQEQQVSSSGRCAVETIGQPTKLHNEHIVSIAYLRAGSQCESANEFRFEQHPNFSPNVTLLPVHLVYTLTTSSYL